MTFSAPVKRHVTDMSGERPRPHFPLAKALWGSSPAPFPPGKGSGAASPPLTDPPGGGAATAFAPSRPCACACARPHSPLLSPSPPRAPHSLRVTCPPCPPRQPMGGAPRAAGPFIKSRRPRTGVRRLSGVWEWRVCPGRRGPVLPPAPLPVPPGKGPGLCPGRAEGGGGGGGRAGGGRLAGEGRPCRGRAAPERAALSATARAGPAPRPAGRDCGAGGARAVPAELAQSHRWPSGSGGAVSPQKGCVCVSPPVCRPTSVPELYVFSNKLSLPCFSPRPPGFCFVDVGGFML